MTYIQIVLLSMLIKAIKRFKTTVTIPLSYQKILPHQKGNRKWCLINFLFVIKFTYCKCFSKIVKLIWKPKNFIAMTIPKTLFLKCGGTIKLFLLVCFGQKNKYIVQKYNQKNAHKIEILKINYNILSKIQYTKASP